MTDDHEARLRQYERFQDALAALVAAVQWTPVPLADDAGQDPTQPYATHEGVLELPGLGCVPCYLLKTGEPVFDLEILEQLLGRDATEEARGWPMRMSSKPTYTALRPSWRRSPTPSTSMTPTWPSSERLSCASMPPWLNRPRA